MAEQTTRHSSPNSRADGSGSKTSMTGSSTVPTIEKINPPRMNSSWYGWPVEEVDPLTFGDTFCVVAKKFQKRYCIHRFSTSKALFLFGPVNPIRKLAIFVTTHRFFDILIVLTILLNCFTLALTRNYFKDGKPYEPDPAPWDIYMDLIEYVFLAIYCLESVLKVVSKGLIFNKFSYLRNWWNLLDCTVVTSGIITAIWQLVYHLQEETDEVSDEISALVFLRTLRVLRVIKIVSIHPGLKMMINALLSSARRLFEVMALMVGCLLVFALVAVELFQSKLRNKCVLDKGGDEDSDISHAPLASIANKQERDKMWTEWVSDWKNWAQRYFPNTESTQCGNGSWSRPCPPGFTCIGLISDNPDDGWTSFDRIDKALLSTFQIMTADYWERVYDVVMSTSGISSLFFFIPIIFLGSYYLLNLLKAVVTLSYEDEAMNSAEEKSLLSVDDRLNLNKENSTFSFDQVSAVNIGRLTEHKPRTKSESQGLQEVRSSKLDRENAEGENNGKSLHSQRPLNAAYRLSTGKRVDTKHEGSSSYSIWPTGYSNSFSSKKSINSNASETFVEEDEEIRYQKEPNPCYLARKRAFGGLSKTLLPFVNSKYFEWGITVCIVLNTACLAVEYHGQSKLQEQFLKYFNYIFMVVFAGECILKSLALQLTYFRSGWNIFDFIVVVISFLDFILTEGLGLNSGGVLSVCRSMRLLRVFRLAQTWLTMKVLLNIIFASFVDLGHLVLLLMIVIYIFAIMGIQVVGRAYSPGAFEATHQPASFPRWHWADFRFAFMMVFRVLCGEWIEPLWDCLKAQKYYSSINDGNRHIGYAKCFLIYLPTLIVGNFIVFNLFLAMLLNSFDTEQLNAEREKELEASGRAQNMKHFVRLIVRNPEIEVVDDIDEDSIDGSDEEDTTEKSTASSKATGASLKINRQDPPLRKFKNLVTRIIVRKRIDEAQIVINRATNHHVATGGPRLSNKVFLKNPAGHIAGSIADQTPDSSEASKKHWEPEDCCPTCKCCKCCKCCERSWCGCCCKTGIYARNTFGDEDKGPNVFQKCRIWSATIVSHTIFEWTILFLIFCSSLLLCFEDNELDNKPKLKFVLCWLNYVFTALFVIEMILKWFAIGLYRYFTSFWTILDGFIVIVSLISLMFDISVGASCSSSPTQSGWIADHKDNFDALKVLRTLRALRPLRAISRWRGMKIVVNALIHAIPSIINVTLVCVIFWLIFAIMGVQFFKGGFYRCVDNEGDMIDPRAVPNKEVCCAKVDTHDYSWINTISNYDNVLEAYLSLFQVATFEGWMELMVYSVDYVGVDKQPNIDNNIYYYLFYVIFIIFGSFFSLQLFISVIVDNFSVLKKKYEGGILEVLLTPQQRSYYVAMKNLGKRVPKRTIPKPKSKCLRFFYYVGSGKKLETFILIMISLNLCVEAAAYSDTSAYLEHVLQAASAFFAVFYLLEVIIKLLGLGKYYFTIPWNVYDFILCIASLLVTFLARDFTDTMPLPPAILRVLRILRLGRILRSVKAAKGIRKLMIALTSSIPALFNIGALLLLVTFMYAILGMALFGNAPRKWSIDDVFNFESFFTSCLVLFRLMTAAGWNEVLDSLTVRNSECGRYRHLDCGRKNESECPLRYLVVPYIVSYLWVTNQILMNLFVAIILENYVQASNEEDLGIVDDDFEMFYVHWARHDPYATQFIPLNELSDFLDSLAPPLGIKKPNMLAIVAFDLPIARGDRIHCLDILHAMLSHSLGNVEESPVFRKLRNRMERKFQKRFPNRDLLEIVSTTRQWKTQQNAAITLQRAWRQYAATKRFMARTTVIPTEDVPGSGPSVQSQTEPSIKSQRGGMGRMLVRMGEEHDQ